MAQRLGLRTINQKAMRLNPSTTKLLWLGPGARLLTLICSVIFWSCVTLDKYKQFNVYWAANKV